ncbi:hypothetical protein A0H81_14830 [Grifola frondosa]|uniref:DUF6534 domain-containing protein n=1 Tax=Grifola frondosa TaxID=5627 RepID=A0A1C7LKX8_GRIFR|nr:hypothetical protein A0H81_14830 [Grifola frondosa]
MFSDSRVVEVQVVSMTALRNTLGAVLLGSLISMFLSGAVTMQTVLYFQLYPRDALRVKLMVSAIWILDLAHAAMACTANWEYLIANFGNSTISDTINWSVAVTVALTALVTFLVHCFFSHRIHTLSRGNLYVTGGLCLLSLVRLVAAFVTAAEMIRLQNYDEFVRKFGWVFTLGLALSAALDVMIAMGLCFYLRRGRTGFSSMDRIIDSITLYTIENGLLTCVTTIVSLICWVVMSHNLIFLGLHFAISKLYANSFLATLNARKSLLSRSQGSSDRDHPLPVLFPDSYSRRSQFNPFTARSQVDPTGTRLQINVQKTIQCENDGEPSGYASSDSPPEDASEGDITKSSRP